MPDEAAPDHSGISVPSCAGSAQTSGETVVTDYTAVPEMIAALQFIHDAAMPHLTKRILAVMALLRVVAIGSWSDPRAAQQVMDLLPSGGARRWRELMRGMVAAAVAWLRAGHIDEMSALEKLLKTNQPPFILGFTATNARRWFHDVTEGRAPSITIEIYRLMAPDQRLSPTQDEAKRRALELLHSVRLLNPAPLAKKTPPKRVPKISVDREK
jgi:hypothetical protein